LGKLVVLALGGVKLQVPYWEVEEALEILSLPEVHNEADTCKSCGSSETLIVVSSGYRLIDCSLPGADPETCQQRPDIDSC